MITNSLKKTVLTANVLKHMLGITIHGSVREFDYVITNTGTEPVTPDINVSCGCTIPKLEPKTIQPGQSALLQAKFDSLGRSGLIEKSIWLSVPGMTNLTLKFNTNVVQKTNGKN